MINENKLIQDIHNYFIERIDKSGLEFIDNDLLTLNKDICTIVKNQPKVDNWIPCSERLPDGCSDAEIEVIVSTHESYSETLIDDSGFALYYPGTNKFHSVYGDRLDITEYVVAWQPLPTPYNKKRGGKNE